MALPVAMTSVSFAAIVLVTMGLQGCKSDECQRLRAEYAQVLEANQKARARVTADAPAQIGLQLHEDLLTGIVHNALTSGKKVYRAQETIAGGNRLSADVSLTRATVRFGRGCNDCIEINGRLTMASTITAGGVIIFRGSGGADLVAQAPLRLALDDDVSRLTVDLRRVEIRKLAVRGAGGSLPWNRILGASAQSLLRAAGSEITVAAWRPLQLPGTTVRVAARELKVFRKEHTAWIGFSVDIPTDGDGIKPAATLERKETVAVTFTGAVLTHLTQELLGTGALPARLNDDFKPDSSGHHLVSVDRIVPDDDGMLTDFTIWRLPPQDDECYAAQVRARTLLQVKRSRGGKTPIHLQMTDGQIVATRGDDDLLQIGLWLRSVFVSDTLEAQSRLLTIDTIEFGPLGQHRVDIQRVDYGAERIEVAGALTAADRQ